MGLKERIKILMKDHCNGSRKLFSDRVGIVPSTIQAWDDEHFPKGDILKRIRGEFGVNINWLLTGEGERYDKGDGGKGSIYKDEGYDFKVGDFKPDYQAENISPGLGQAVEYLTKILGSGDQLIIHAILFNLKAFSQSVDIRRSDQARIEALEDNRSMDQARIRGLQERIETLERKLNTQVEDIKKQTEHK